MNETIFNFVNNLRGLLPETPAELFIDLADYRILIGDFCGDLNPRLGTKVHQNEVYLGIEYLVIRNWCCDESLENCQVEDLVFAIGGVENNLAMNCIKTLANLDGLLIYEKYQTWVEQGLVGAVRRRILEEYPQLGGPYEPQSVVATNRW